MSKVCNYNILKINSITEFMKNHKKKYLLLFDIDGTILNFKSGLAKDLFLEILKDVFNGEIPEEAFPNFAGMTDLSILRAINDHMGHDFSILENKIEVVWQKMVEVFKEHTTTDNVTLMPGIEDLLNLIEEESIFQTGLITGNINQNAYLKLKSHKLDRYFPFGGFGDDFEDRNHLPEIAIKRANLYSGNNIYNNNNTLIIGDTWRDISCAKNSGIKSCAVATGYYPFEELKNYEPDLIFQDFADYISINREFKKLFNIQD
jgi:phosphoglycolate phosphatase